MVFIESPSVFEFFVLAVHDVYIFVTLHQRVSICGQNSYGSFKAFNCETGREDTRTPENCLCFLRGSSHGPQLPSPSSLPVSCPLLYQVCQRKKEKRRRATHFEEGKSEVTRKRQKKQKFPRPPSRSTKTLSTQTKKP